MTEKEHPITPPPKLVEQWSATIYRQTEDDDQRDLYIATQAARWGSDQELEACLGEVSFLNSQALADRVRAARRPKPPSLKELALEELEQLRSDAKSMGMGFDAPIIRRALERLDD